MKKSCMAIALALSLGLSSLAPVVTVNAEEGSNEVGVATATSAERAGSSAVQESNKLYITEENFPDAGLRKGILDSWDMEGEGWVNPDNVISLFMDEMDISSLEGIELFPNLTLLECKRNNLTSVDVSKNKNLKSLNLEDNQLTTLDVSNNPKLELLGFNSNKISSIDVSKNAKLLWLQCVLTISLQR